MTGSFAAFERFVSFFKQLFAQPGLLADANCRQSYKGYVVNYYREMFGPTSSPGSPRHVRWYRRLTPLLALPRGSRILDYGGGYGMDSIFLASVGYEVVFYELTPHHIAIARWFADRFGAAFGKLPVRYSLVGVDREPAGLDAVFADEVAHHIEPAQRVFDDAARMLRAGGHFHLLEPNYLNPMTQAFFLKGRGFRTTTWRIDETTGKRYLYGNEHIRPIWTWNRFAREAGLTLQDIQYVSPWYSGPKLDAPLSQAHGAERLPLARAIAASHVGLHYAKL